MPRLTIPQKIAFFLVLSSVILILIYALISNLLDTPEYAHFAFGDNDTKSRNKQLYIDERSLHNGSISGESISQWGTYRTLERPSTLIELRPSIYPDDITYLFAELVFQPTEFNLELAPRDCDTCSDHNYVLYQKGLEEYASKNIHQTGTGETVFSYVTDAALHSDDYLNGSLEEWIATAVPKDKPITIPYNTRERIDWTLLENDSISSTETDTTLPYTFNPNQTFFVHSHSNQLAISFEKKNLNINSGGDTLRVELRSLTGEIYDSFGIEDDGITSGSKKQIVQSLSDIYLYSRENEIVQLVFVPLENTDFRISNLTLNTDKIVFENMTLSAATVYTSALADSSLLVEPHSKSLDGVQLQKIGGDLETVANPETSNGTANAIDIQAGSYELTFDNFNTIRNGLFAHSADAFFNPFTHHITTYPLSDIALTASNISKTANGVSAEYHFFNDSIIDNISTEDDSKILFELVASHHTQPNSLSNAVWQKYKLHSSACGYSIYSIRTTTAEYPSSADCSNNGLLTWIENVVPQYSTLAIRSEAFPISSTASIDSATINSTTTDQNSINIQARGEFEAALYAENGLEMEIRTRDLNTKTGADDIRISVIDQYGVKHASVTVEDDGDESNSEVSAIDVTTTIDLPELSGLYFLTIEEIGESKKRDYIIESININTNKFVVVDVYALRYGGTVYIENERPIDINAQAKIFKNIDPIDFRIDDKTEHTITKNSRSHSATLTPGFHTVELTGGPIDLEGAPFAFSEDAFFDFNPYSEGDEYLIVDEIDFTPTTLFEFSVTYD